MPCHSCETSHDAAYRDRDHYKEELDKVTRLLCAVMHALTRHNTTKPSPAILLENIEGLAEWWDEHQRFDKLRQAEEARREQEKVEEWEAWNKLTPRQRRLLGARKPS